MVKMCAYSTSGLEIYTLIIFSLAEYICLCFTENKSATNLNIASVIKIEDYPGLENWTTIHKDTRHWWAICHDSTKVGDVM